MGLPAGVTTFALRYGNSGDYAGDPLRRTVVIKPSHTVIWAATGDPLLPRQIRREADPGELGEIDLPHTDQDGFVDQRGNEIRNFWYTVQTTDYADLSAVEPSAVRKVQATSDVEVVDLELVPINGSVGPVGLVPMPGVTSVNGSTGAVTVDGASDSSVNAILADTDSESYATLAGTFGRIPDGTRLVATGDSLTSLAGGGAPYMGWATQLGIISEGRVRVLRNAGVAGDNAADLLARLQADVIAHAPNLVSVWIGANDVTQGRTLAAFKADIQAIVAALKTAGSAVVLFTIPPRADATKAATISAWNAWIKSYARDAAVHLVDAHAVLADPATSTYRAGFDAGDGIHITQAGHNAVADLFAQTILPRLVASEPILPLSNVDPANLLTNGLFLTNVDGYPLVPDSFYYINGEAAVTVGIVDDGDFQGGKAWQYAAVNPTSFQEFLQNASGAWSVGDRLLFTVRVKVLSSSGVSGSAGLNVNCNFFGSSGINPAAQFIALPELEGYVAAEFVVPAGTTTVQLDCVFNIGSSASATYRVGEFAIFNLTTMGAV